MTEDEIKKLWTALDGANAGTKPQRKLRIVTAGSLKLRLITVQRGGEVQGMEWADLDLNTAWRSIPAEKSVDKFQGKEAEVVLISMVTSGAEDLLRLIEFLYSKNRLNVAISRARCLAVVVANPHLLEIPCN